MTTSRSLLFVCVLIALAVCATAYTLTQADLDLLEQDIRTRFNLTEPQYGLRCTACNAGDNIGAIIRLAFHDAAGAGGPNGNGGANGCIDFRTSDHKGLEEVVSQFDDIYYNFPNGWQNKISKADLYAFGATVAIATATTAANTTGKATVNIAPTPGTLRIPFRYGRKDDFECSDQGLLPPASFSWSDMFTLFHGRFGLNTAEISAIMGAHSTGRTEFKNQGFEGGWVLHQSSLSSGYFASLTTISWNNTNSSNVFVHFPVNAGNPITIMLKVDIEPMFSPSSSCPFFATFASASSNCTQNRQNDSPVNSALYYAQNISAFHANFSTAFQKLINAEHYSVLTAVGSQVPFDYPNKPSSSSDSLSTGAIVGIAVGSAVAAVIALSVGVLVFRRIKTVKAETSDVNMNTRA